MAEMLPTHFPRSPRVPTTPKPHSLLQRVVQYPTKVVPARYFRWLPYVFAIPLVLWFVGPYTWRFARPPPPDFGGPFGAHPRPPHHRPPFHLQHNSSNTWDGRAVKVRDAFKHAYSNYLTHAFPDDEIRPIDGGRQNNFVGWGVNVFDSLDTMWIMGLDEYFHDAVKYINTVDFYETQNHAPFFEVVIRYLGGLLSAYALSGEPILLKKADELGTGLLPVFNTPSGLPHYAINLKTGDLRGGWAGSAVWSESMSCQMEYKYLAHLTGKHEFYRKVEKITDLMYDFDAKDGFPTMWDWDTGKPRNNVFSIGSAADSGYEYFIKQWLLSGRTEKKPRDLYLKSAKLIIDKLLYISPHRKLLYVTDTNLGKPSHTLEHLSCFLPGMFALGAHTLDLSPEDKELHMWVAKGLTHTCYLTYADQPSGLGPDIMEMMHYQNRSDGLWVNHLDQWKKDGRPGGIPPGLTMIPPEPVETKKDYTGRGRAYLLRPETVESLYLLWRTTGDVSWRTKGWEIFQAIEKYAKTEFGYASIGNVYEAPPTKINESPSYFLAETLKYLYLLFTDTEIIPLDKYVFNTEAHPLPIFQWMESEMSAYHIS